MAELIYLVANGDLRLSANRKCWAAQQQAEQAIMEAIRREGRQIERAHPYDEARGHGFIDSQKRGNQVFRDIPPDAPLVVCEAVWQYLLLNTIFWTEARSKNVGRFAFEVIHY
jgi:hypothetical protein